MTVLSGGLSDGHLWDWERRRDTFAGFDYKLPVPMLPMTAADLGCVERKCPAGLGDPPMDCGWPECGCGLIIIRDC